MQGVSVKKTLVLFFQLINRKESTMTQRKKNLIMFVILALSVLITNTALGQDKPEHWPATVAIGSGTGTTYYAIAGGLGKMMDNYLGVAGIPTKTSGGTETARLMAKDELQIGFLTPDIAYEASMGKKRFKDAGPLPLRVFLQDFPLSYNLVTLKGSGINSWSDIEGKRGYFKARASGVMAVLWDAMLRAYDIDENNFKKILPFDRSSEYVDALKMGKMDFAVDMGLHPSAKWTELSSTHPMKIVGIDEAHLKKIKKELPYVFSSKIEGGTYKTIEKEITVPTVAVVLDVVKNLPDDFVYELTKMVWTHFDEFKTYHPACKYFSQEAVERTNYLYQDGSIKYYKEAGYWTEDESNRQDKLLSQINDIK